MTNTRNEQPTFHPTGCLTKNEDCKGDIVTATSKVDPSPEIFKLIIDCFNEIFEYLSVKDLHSFGQTCKRMNKVAGDYFKQNYSHAKKRFSNDGIYTQYSDEEGVVEKYTYTSGFNQYMPRISCYSINSVNQLCYIHSHVCQLKSTNHIFFLRSFINDEQIEFFKNLLPQLEVVEMRYCTVECEIYESMLKYCKNIRQIHFHCMSRKLVENRLDLSYTWLLHEYPKLQYLELASDSTRIEELSKFLTLNPNVQRLKMGLRSFWTHRDIFLNSNAKLDVLELDCVYWMNDNSNDFLELLNRLHEKGFYKRLYFYIDFLYEYFGRLLVSVKGVEILRIRFFNDETYNLPQLSNLKELIIMEGSNVTDMNSLANSLLKLERLYIDKCESIDIVLPFIRQSLKLHKVKFIPRNTSEVLNLCTLNKERAKLAGARKLTIYTRDDVFLATKWATKNGDTNLKCIEMRRSDSFDWNDHFYTPFHY